MTNADYSWPRYDIFSNGTLQGNGSWDSIGSPDFGTPAAGYVLLDKDEGVKQDHKLSETTVTEADYGRWVSRYEPLRLDLDAQRVSGVVDGGSVIVLLRKAGEDVKFYYNFHSGDWEPSTEPYADVLDKRFYFGFDSSETQEETFYLPKIWPIASAGKNGEVDDTWTLRIAFVNKSAAVGVLRINRVRLSLWASDVRTAQIGSTTVITNNRNYPVKYDAKVDRVTELSLNGPYNFETGASGSNIPNVSIGSGNLKENNWYGFGFTFMDDETGEESPPPFGRFSSSSFFVDKMTSSPGGFVLDFDEAVGGSGRMVYPNEEALGGTDDGAGPTTVDNTRATKIIIYRTAADGEDDPDDAGTALGGTSQDTVEDLLYNGLAYFDGVVAKGGSYTSAISDADLYKRSNTRGVIWKTQVPAPAHTYNYAFRNRLWVAGGPLFETGTVGVTNNSHFVNGVNRGASGAAPTVWNRGVEGMLFQVDGESDVYRVERYVYPNDDTTGSSGERIYLSTPYKGSTATKKFYRIWPESGRVQYSEEGTPWRFDSGGYFLLDGGKGEAITGIGNASNMLLAFTRNTTASFAYTQVPDAVDANMLSLAVGCVSHDSFVEIEGAAYWLSDRGVVRYTPGGALENLSAPIMGMFSDPGDVDYMTRTPESQLASVAVAAHYAPRNQYLLAVKTKEGRQGADLILAFNYVLNTWDILRLDCEVVRWIHSVDDIGREVLLFANTTGDVYRWDAGLTDGAGEVNYTGTILGTATSATASSLTDTGAQFFVAGDGENFNQISGVLATGLGLDGAWVRITSGTGDGQKRRILRNTATSLIVDQRWNETPNATSMYEIGGYDANLNFKSSNIGIPGRIKRLKQLNLDLKTEGRQGTAKIKVFRDFQEQSQNANRGIVDKTITTGEGGRTAVGLDEASGYALRIRLEADGAQNPIQIRTISAAIEIGESD